MMIQLNVKGKCSYSKYEGMKRNLHNSRLMWFRPHASTCAPPVCINVKSIFSYSKKKKSVPLSSNFPNYSIFLSQNFDIKRNKTHKKYKIEARRFTNQERRKSTFLNTKNGSTTAILLEMEQLLLEFGISFFKSLQHRNADRRHTVLRRWVSILFPNISCRFQFQIMGYISQSCRTERWKPPSVSGNSVEECGKCVCDCEKEKESLFKTH